MLEAAGIQAYVPGANLADQWSETQRAFGNLGTDVFVPSSRLDEARELVLRAGPAEEAEDAGQSLEEEPETPLAIEDAGRIRPLTRREIVFEVVAVSCVAVLPFYLGALSGLVQTGFRPWREGAWDLHGAVVDGVHAILLIVLLRWVISRAREPASDFGWVRFRPVRDLLAGAAVLIGFAFVASLTLYLFAPKLSQDTDSAATQFVLGASARGGPLPAGPFEWPVMIGSAFASALLEELSIRGYLLTRLRTILRSSAQAVIISSFVWAGYHVFQGLVPTAVHVVEGLFLGWAFLKLKRIWPLAIAHAGVNVLITLAQAT
jgi:membrane protease YdiL (CAAX protease family)